MGSPGIIGPDILQRAAAVLAPRTDHVFILNVTDTAARFVVPDAMKGRFCKFTMDGADADILFGGSGVVCAYGTASSVASEVITVNATSGGHLKDGFPDQWIVPNDEDHAYFSVDCKGGGSGKLYIEVRSS